MQSEIVWYCDLTWLDMTWLDPYQDSTWLAWFVCTVTCLIIDGRDLRLAWDLNMCGLPPPLVITDHKNLEYLQSFKRLNTRLVRSALFFTHFQFSKQQKPCFIISSASSGSQRTSSPIVAHSSSLGSGSLWAEYAQISLKETTTPFQCILGYQPPLFPWTEEPSAVPGVEHWFWVSERVWDSSRQCGDIRPTQMPAGLPPYHLSSWK